MDKREVVYVAWGIRPPPPLPCLPFGQPAQPPNADRKWVMASKSPSMHKTPDGTGQHSLAAAAALRLK